MRSTAKTKTQRRYECFASKTGTWTTIRRSRLQRLGSDKGGDYADPSKVADEIEYANDLFRKNRRWAVFNVTGKALEETASEIIKLITGRRQGPRPMGEVTQSDLSSRNKDEK